VATVFIPAMMRSMTGGAAQVPASGATVRDVIEDLVRQHPALTGRVVDENGVRPELFIAVGSEEIFNLDQAVAEGAEVHLLAAIAGG